MSKGTRHRIYVVLSSVLCLAALVAGVATAIADEAPELPGQQISPPPYGQILGSAGAEAMGASTDPEAADELPHQDLDRGEAIDLLRSVFGEQLESPAATFDGRDVQRYYSDHVALVPAEGGEGQDNLLESMLPLRTEDAAGQKVPVDLTLEPVGGELRPADPLVEVGIPDQLGDGISLPEAGIEIHIAGAPEERSPSTVVDSTAVFPNVATDSDLTVAPAPAGVETFTQLRTPDAPQTQTLEFTLPAGASIRQVGPGAEVVRNGDTIATVPPPTAIDAAGEAVPVSLNVSGSSIEIVASPDASTSYPVLVDPVVETYFWTETYNQYADWYCAESVPGTLLFCSTMGTWGNQYGLNLKSSSWAAPPAVPVGSQATWNYYVPRYFTDLADPAVKQPPTSWIDKMEFSNVYWWLEGESPPYAVNPWLAFGIWDSNKNAFATAVFRNGAEGPMSSATVKLPNYSHVTDVKNGGVALVTGETPRQRHVWIQQAAVEVTDADYPNFVSAKGPSKWVNGVATEPIEFKVSDSGLGVSAVIGSVPMLSGGVTDWRQNQGCSGSAHSACPRTWSANFAYNPATMAAGEDVVELSGVDPIEHKSKEKSQQALVKVKVDHAAPTLAALTGTITEQAKLGTKLPSYTVKATAEDGATAAPQSGIASAEIKVDGKKVEWQSEAQEKAWSPKCATKNCPLSAEWTLESRKYSPGEHTLEVIATDAVGISSSPKTIKFSVEPDSTAPSLAVTGSMTEQASLGTTRPQYKLKLRASDGTLAEPSAAEGGPAAAYALDETSGTSAKDAAGNHTGTVTAPTWAEGKYGKALSFNGSSSCLSVPNSVDLQLSGNFTLSAWVKPSNTTQWAPIFYKEAESFYSYSLFFGAFEAGHVQGYIADKPWEYTEVESPGKLTANTWAHVAMTSDGTTLRLYVNGTQVDSGSAKAAMESKQPLLIGCAKNFGEYFNGSIDNVRVFNRALSASEIEGDKASAVKVPAPEGPTAAYALDETSGTSAKDLAGTHNATVSGTASWVEGKYGKALSFNGENTCASVANSSDLQLNGPFTLEAWVKPSNTTQWAPIFYKEAGSFYGYSIFFGAFNAGHIQGYISEHSWEYTEVESPGTLTANTWAHVAMTSDGATMRLYVNGTQVDTSPASTAIASTGPLLIGCAKNFNEYFKGAIDNVRIFNRALTAAEVEADKAAAVGTASGPMQSGIAKTEITLDGKVVDSSTGCATENCSVAREYTLSSAPNPGKHTVVSKVTDGFGNTTSKTTEIEVQPDTTKPTITTGGALSNAPSGWVEQEGYGFTASAKDAGYGVTSLALKIDGTQVAGATASCADGGCEASVQKTINMASYSGGAHPAEVIATDGAGNTSTQKWTVNVDPKGAISATEATDTAEALEATAPEIVEKGPANAIVKQEVAEGGEGEEEPVSLVNEGGQMISEGAPASSTIQPDPDDGFAVNAQGFDSEMETSHNQTIEVAPVTTGAGASSAVIADDSAATYSNTASGVDTIIRPAYDGVMAFQAIRDLSAPESYSWEVALGEEESLKQLDEQHVGIFWEDGTQVMLISAQPAHDADGKAVNTTLAVSEGNVVIETIHYREPGITFPVVAGLGWEGGFTIHSGEIIEEPELPVLRLEVGAPIVPDAGDSDAASVSGTGKLVRPWKAQYCNPPSGLLEAFECEKWIRFMKGFFFFNNAQAWYPAHREPKCWDEHFIGYWIEGEPCEWVGPNHQKYVAGAWTKVPNAIGNVYSDTEKWHISAQTRFGAGVGSPPVSLGKNRAMTIAGLGDGRVLGWFNDHVCNPMVAGCVGGPVAEQ